MITCPDVKIPAMLAALEDELYRSLPGSRTELFFDRFYDAACQRDQSRTVWHFLEWLIVKPRTGKHADVAHRAQVLLGSLQNGREVDQAVCMHIGAQAAELGMALTLCVVNATFTSNGEWVIEAIKHSDHSRATMAIKLLELMERA